MTACAPFCCVCQCHRGMAEAQTRWRSPTSPSIRAFARRPDNCGAQRPIHPGARSLCSHIPLSSRHVRASECHRVKGCPCMCEHTCGTHDHWGFSWAWAHRKVAGGISRGRTCTIHGRARHPYSADPCSGIILSHARRSIFEPIWPAAAVPQMREDPLPWSVADESPPSIPVEPLPPLEFFMGIPAPAVPTEAPGYESKVTTDGQALRPRLWRGEEAPLEVAEVDLLPSPRRHTAATPRAYYHTSTTTPQDALVSVLHQDRTKTAPIPSPSTSVTCAQPPLLGERIHFASTEDLLPSDERFAWTRARRCSQSFAWLVHSGRSNKTLCVPAASTRAGTVSRRHARQWCSSPSRHQASPTTALR